MLLNLFIIDDFYANPDNVRNFALAQPFDQKGNYPGLRTKSFLWEDVKDIIQKTIEPLSGKVTDWLDRDGLTGSFQITTASDRTWIHSDQYNTWAGVCYLTPNAPISSGTALYKHKHTGHHYEINQSYPYEGYDYTKWEKDVVIGNKYNRLILYRGSLFHASQDYFGSSLENGRLFQVFFFNTER